MIDKLTELNDNKLIRLREQLNKIVGPGFKVFEEFNRKTYHISINVYASYYLRFIYCFKSVLTLLKDFENNKSYHDYSIALILRASLLDFLTILYLKSYYEELDSEQNNTIPNYNSEFGKLLSSQIRRGFNISNADKKSKYYKPEIFKKFVDVVYAKYKYLFDSSKQLDYNAPSKSLIYGNRQDEISNKVIRTRLDSVQGKSNTNHVHIFSLYEIYSKHDHFGLMSMTLKWMDINEIFQNILWSLYYLVDGISYCMEFMRQEEVFENEYNLIRRECGSLRGVVVTESLYLSENYKRRNR